MATIRVTKEFTFEMAHALLGYDGLCKYIHGHSYRLSVTVIGEPTENNNDPKNGMVMDFRILKKIVKTTVVDVFDHALVLNKKTPHKKFKGSGEIFDKLMLVDYQPTSENLVVDFANRINEKLPRNIKLYSLRIRETASSYVEWFADDND